MDPNIDTSWREEIPFALITQEQVDSRLQCSICLDDFTLRENVRRLGCAHVFHDQCITPWLNRNNICPTCRRISTNRPLMNITEEFIDVDNSDYLDDSSGDDDSPVEWGFSDDDEEDHVLSVTMGDALFDTESDGSTSFEEIIDDALENSDDTHVEFMDDDDYGDVEIVLGSDEDEDSAPSSPSLQSDDEMFDRSGMSDLERECSELEEILDEL